MVTLWRSLLLLAVLTATASAHAKPTTPQREKHERALGAPEAITVTSILAELRLDPCALLNNRVLRAQIRPRHRWPLRSAFTTQLAGDPTPNSAAARIHLPRRVPLSSALDDDDPT